VLSKKAFFLSFCCVLSTYQVTAQRSALDNLQVVYQTAKADTTKVLALAEIAYLSHSNRPDSSIALAQQALAQSQKINFEKGIAYSLSVIGSSYGKKGMYPVALDYFKKSQSIY
jgi:hypothetical protein